MSRRPASSPSWGLDLRFLLFVVAFVGAIGGGSTYSLHRLRLEVVARAATVTTLHAQAVEDHLTQGLAVIDEAIAHTLAIGPDARDARDARDVRDARRLEARLEELLQISPAVRSLSVLDGEGRVAVSTNPANVGVSVDTREPFPAAEPKRGILRIGRPWSGRDLADGSAVGPQSVGLGFIPLVRGAGADGAGPMVVVTLNPDFFASHAAARLAPERGSLEVLRYDGVLLLTADGPASPDEAPRRTQMLRELAEVEVGNLEETLPDGQEVFTSFRASTKFPLLVVVRVTRGHALEPWERERDRLLSFALPGLLGVLGLGVPLSVLLRKRQERRLEQQHRERERLAATVFQTVDSGVAICDGALRIIAVNPAFTAITGYTEEAVAGRSLWAISTMVGPDEHVEEVEAALQAGGSWQGEGWNRHQDGRPYVAWLSINQVRGGDPRQYVVAISDITERRASEERIRHLAHHDPLTGLPNRTVFWDRLEQALARSRRERDGASRLGLLYIDLDNFKPVNDTLGHQAGDQLLQAAAGRMLGSLRSSDTVARLGGDEFAVLLPSIEASEDALRVGEKIRLALAEPYDLGGQVIAVSSSIGVAVWPDDGSSGAELAKNADDAMYRAKASGRNRIVAFVRPAGAREAR